MTVLAARPPTPETATAVEPVPVPGDRTAVAVVPSEIVEAERRWWRGLLLGIAIGIPVCALIWMGLVALALGVVADSDWPIWPAVGMAAVVGVFAGAFLGGWAGVTACAEHLDEAEFHTPFHTPR